MNKKIRALLSLAFCLCLILSTVLPVCAEEVQTQVPVQVQTLKISSTADFLAFAENCRMDSYSENLTVYLETDIDLTGLEFAPIPIFSGTFEGGHHTITGLQITADGSVQGLFRYLTQTAAIRDLVVMGEVTPQGSRSIVGGISGSNAGTVENCSFSGTVSGSDSVGGLVGINTVTGILDNCRAEGSVQGDHFAGGLAGENYGVIRSSTNAAAVNTTTQQNSVDISDITMDTLTNSEAANTVTDIGGIAGTNGGVIRSCTNRGNVGYRQMGYNIGGIAGSQTGYIADSDNYAAVSGRKEVGGIVGQMEPVTQINYSEDTLQTLQQQMNTLSALTNRATANAQGGAADITGQLADLEDQIGSAADALEQLVPDAESPELPDADSLLAAQNALSSAMSAMNSTMSQIASTTQSTAANLSKDMQAVAGQMSEMSQTINEASENLGGSIEDISDADTPEDITGKVTGCTNYGPVLADLNVGGIAGAMSLENDLDPETDLQISGDSSLNFDTQLRAVVRGCKNHGVITARKQHAGGIVGWQSLGLVKDCVSSGRLDAQDTDYVGGIAGRSSGYIRGSSAKCEITGGTYVGGIAGCASVVSECRSMVRVTGSEKMGAVLGAAQDSNTEEEDPIRGNYYLSVDADLGGIDGISYSALAEPLTQEEFLALTELPGMFHSVTVRFLLDDGTEKAVSLATGGTLAAQDIPAVPEKAGYVGQWAGLAEAELTGISFDMAFTAEYTANSTTIQSEQVREDGLPVLLAQGDFLTGQTVTVQALNVMAQPLPEEAGTLIDAWSFQLPSAVASQLRYHLPEGYEAEDVQLMVCRSATGWEEVEFTANGSYLVFSAGEDAQALCLLERPESYLFEIVTAGAAVLVLAAAVLLYRRSVSRRKKAQVPSSDESTQ